MDLLKSNTPVLKKKCYGENFQLEWKLETFLMACIESDSHPGWEPNACELEHKLVYAAAHLKPGHSRPAGCYLSLSQVPDTTGIHISVYSHFTGESCTNQVWWTGETHW